MNNAVINCIHNRRSVRKFEKRQIADEQLDALLDAAIWAPSGGNNQSWLFTAIQNEAVLLRLNEAVREGFRNWVPDDDYPAKQTIGEKSQKEGYNFYFNAPTLIIASNRPNYANAMADCSLALENIFLAAESIGLSSCYINQLRWLRDDAGVREYLCELGIPKEHVICSAAAIGYAAMQPQAPARKEGTTNIIR